MTSAPNRAEATFRVDRSAQRQGGESDQESAVRTIAAISSVRFISIPPKKSRNRQRQEGRHVFHSIYINLHIMQVDILISN